MEQLRELMHHLDDSASLEPMEKVLKFRPAQPTSEKNEGTAATLNLVYQAAEVIKAIEDHATEMESCAQALAKRAIEKLRLAESRVQSAEAARLAAEARIIEANAKVQEAERFLAAAQSRIASVEAKIATAEQRARSAEAQAGEAAQALIRIEEAIRTQLLTPRRKELAAA